MNETTSKTSWSETSTVNEIVQLHPHALRVFKAFGVDSCCGGALTLREAAARAGVEVGVLETALAAALPEAASP